VHIWILLASLPSQHMSSALGVYASKSACLEKAAFEVKLNKDDKSQTFGCLEQELRVKPDGTVYTLPVQP
jgi:hypothetical protein